MCMYVKSKIRQNIVPSEPCSIYIRLSLCGRITPIWEDVAPEVTVSSVGNTSLQDTLG